MPGLEAVTTPYIVVDDFLPLEAAMAMRKEIEAHFASPGAHKAPTHQIWNYWFVPGLYTYLRTHPAKLIDEQKIAHFMNTLRAFSAQKLGFASVGSPYLSMYVAGCRQNVHNDSENGRFAYVYSLTKDERLTTGGETMVFREGDLFRENLGRANAGPGFYASVPPKFNRLVIFDDRMPHGVERVDGSMDPVEGRFVFHGHIRESGTLVVGALTAPVATEVVMSALVPFCDDYFARIQLYHGPVVFRLEVAPSGTVTTCALIVDRVAGADRGDVVWPELRADLLQRFQALQFPAASGPTLITQPVIFGKTRFSSDAKQA